MLLFVVGIRAQLLAYLHEFRFEFMGLADHNNERTFRCIHDERVFEFGANEFAANRVCHRDGCCNISIACLRGFTKHNSTHINALSWPLLLFITQTKGRWTAIYATKTDEFVCPPNISETVAVRITKLAHRPRIASTTIKLISKQNLLSI